MVDYYRKIGDILGAGGEAYAIIPIGDPKHENDAKTAVDTVGGGAGNGLAFTYSKNRQTWDAPAIYTGRGNIPRQPVDGVDEEATSGDAAFWTRALAPFSVGAWVYPEELVASDILLGKWDDTSAAEAREWLFYLSGIDYVLQVYDETDNAQLGRFANDVGVTGLLQYVVGTYDGGTLSSGIKVYVDGVQRDDTDFESGTFVTMQDTATVVSLGYSEDTGGAKANFFNGDMQGGPLGPFFTHRELSSQEVYQLRQIGLEALSEAPSLWLPYRRAA